MGHTVLLILRQQLYYIDLQIGERESYLRVFGDSVVQPYHEQKRWHGLKQSVAADWCTNGNKHFKPQLQKNTAFTSLTGEKNWRVDVAVAHATDPEMQSFVFKFTQYIMTHHDEGQHLDWLKVWSYFNLFLKNYLIFKVINK